MRKHYNRELFDELFLDHHKVVYSKIELLDWEDNSVKEVQGKVISGGINLDGNSSVRRSCSLSIAIDDFDYQIEQATLDFNINKKVRIHIGLSNNTQYYKEDKIIWFEMGVFILTEPMFSHSTDSVTFSINGQDKMCMLNGSLGGELEEGIDFSYKDSDGKDWSMSWYDIVKSTAVSFAGIPEGRVVINDIPQKIKAIKSYGGKTQITADAYDTEGKITKVVFNPGDTVYVERKFGPTDPYLEGGQEGYRVQSGAPLTSIFDHVKDSLGNFEYFFDLEGNFVFQEKKNFINNYFQPILQEINSGNYEVDFRTVPYIYDFSDKPIVSSFSNSPDWTGIKNNFIINSQVPLSENPEDIKLLKYQVVIDKKPVVPEGWDIYSYNPGYDLVKNGWKLVPEEDGKVGAVPTTMHDTRIPRLIGTDGRTYEIESIASGQIKFKEVLGGNAIGLPRVVFNNNSAFALKLQVDSQKNVIPIAESTAASKEKWLKGALPYPFQQYIIDLGDIQFALYPESREKDVPRWYNVLKKNWHFTYNAEIRGYLKYALGKTDAEKYSVYGNTSEWIFYFDIIDESSAVGKFSVNSIGLRTKVENSTTIYNIYPTRVDYTEYVLLSQKQALDFNGDFTPEAQDLLNSNQKIIVVDNTEIDNFKDAGTVDAFAKMRDMVWLHTSFNEVVNMSAIPLYFLEPNRKILISDRKSNISGDFFITSISIPLEFDGQMNISALKATPRL